MSTNLAFYFQGAACVRGGDVRVAPWADIDDKAKLWRIPPEGMTMRVGFLQPVSRSRS